VRNLWLDDLRWAIFVGQRLQADHKAREIRGDGHVTARQLLHRAYAVVFVIHRAQQIRAQQLRQFARIGAIALVAHL
jgi:hypothetical protein